MVVSLLLGKPDISLLANMLFMPLTSIHINLFKKIAAYFLYQEEEHKTQYRFNSLNSAFYTSEMTDNNIKKKKSELSSFKKY